MRLTRQEIYIVIFILGALVVGSAVKHYRHRARSTPAAVGSASGAQ